MRAPLIIILIKLVFLLGCASHGHKAQIVDAQPIPSQRLHRHVVAPGDTLYSIALRYDMDYKNIAKINSLDRNYRIMPGQVLDLRPRAEARPAPVPAARTGVASAAPKAPVQAPPASTRSKNQSTPPPQAKPSPAKPDAIPWQWPLKGEVLERFHSNGGLNKGIDIRGKLGEPVLAAAAGEVVYAGSGLRGYGNLIILKHSENSLSAYAHNRVLLVTEGSKVRAGQKIAEVGSSGTNTIKLHFEIRVDGQPVDPLKHLPRL